MSTSTDALWAAYTAAHPEFANRPAPAVEQFGDHPRLIDELLGLVVTGTKRATASLLLDYPADGPPPPAPGDHWIVADGIGTPTLVLRTVETRTGVLESVDDAFAFDEGEDERTRDAWLREHRRYFTRTLPPGAADLEEQPILFERFAVVWPPERVIDADRAAVQRLREPDTGRSGPGQPS